MCLLLWRTAHELSEIPEVQAQRTASTIFATGSSSVNRCSVVTLTIHNTSPRRAAWCSLAPPDRRHRSTGMATGPGCGLSNTRASSGCRTPARLVAVPWPRSRWQPDPLPDFELVVHCLAADDLRRFHKGLHLAVGHDARSLQSIVVQQLHFLPLWPYALCYFFGNVHQTPPLAAPNGPTCGALSLSQTAQNEAQPVSATSRPVDEKGRKSFQDEDLRPTLANRGHYWRDEIAPPRGVEPLLPD
jgi:hypothetical protein